MMKERVITIQATKLFPNSKKIPSAEDVKKALELSFRDYYQATVTVQDFIHGKKGAKDGET